MRRLVPMLPGRGVYQVCHRNDVRSRRYPGDYTLVATVHADTLIDAMKQATGPGDIRTEYTGKQSVPLRPTLEGDVITEPYGQEWAVEHQHYGLTCRLMPNPALYVDNPRLAEQLEPAPRTPTTKPKERER